MDKKTKAAALAVVTGVFLTIAKLTAGLLTGSVSVLADALHSGVDLMAAIMALIAVRLSARPADAGHPYGHGKVENITGTLEALLIFGAAGYIIFKAIEKLRFGAELPNVDLGLWVVGISIVLNFLVSRHVMKVAKETDSVALEADAYHLTADVITSVGVFLGLVAVRVTGWAILDPLVALGVAVLILKAAWEVTQRAFVDLMDRSLPAEEQATIKVILDKHNGRQSGLLAGYHALRSRKGGAERHVDLHLEVHRDASVQEAHNLCDHLEAHLGEALGAVTVVLHVEPCEPHCAVCDEKALESGRTP